LLELSIQYFCWRNAGDICNVAYTKLCYNVKMSESGAEIVSDTACLHADVRMLISKADNAVKSSSSVCVERELALCCA
jgi:hypothetical protein